MLNSHYKPTKAAKMTVIASTKEYKKNMIPYRIMPYKPKLE